MDTVENEGQNDSEGHRRERWRERKERKKASQPSGPLSLSFGVQYDSSVKHYCQAKSVMLKLRRGGDKIKEYKKFLVRIYKSIFALFLKNTQPSRLLRPLKVIQTTRPEKVLGC